MAAATEKVVGLLDAPTFNSELKAHVVPKEVAIKKYKSAHIYTRYDGSVEHDSPEQLAELLPYAFDDAVKVLSVRNHGSYQGKLSVRYVFVRRGEVGTEKGQRRNAYFKLRITYGSCYACPYAVSVDEYDTFMFDRAIPFVKFEDYDESSSEDYDESNSEDYHESNSEDSNSKDSC